MFDTWIWWDWLIAYNMSASFLIIWTVSIIGMANQETSNIMNRKEIFWTVIACIIWPISLTVFMWWSFKR